MLDAFVWKALAMEFAMPNSDVMTVELSVTWEKDFLTFLPSILRTTSLGFFDRSATVC